LTVIGDTMHVVDPWKGPVLTDNLGRRSLHGDILFARQRRRE